MQPIIPTHFCFTDAELAGFAQCHISTIKRKILSGELQAFRVSERQYRVRREHVLQFLGLPVERTVLIGEELTQKAVAGLLKTSVKSIQRLQTGESGFTLPALTKEAIEAFTHQYAILIAA